MNIAFDVCCIIFAFMAVTNSFKQSADYVHVYNNDNQKPTTNILSELTNIQSLSSCSAMCRKRADSPSFFYNSAIKECLCAGKIQQSDLQPFNGYVHFSTSDVSPWRVFGKSQYLHIRDQMKWLDAQLECKKLGAKLAEIETSEEISFLKNYARETNFGTAFIGGTDAFSQDRWRWSTTFEPITVSDWAPNKPEASGNDECIAMDVNVGMSWDDYSCDIYSFSFICERMMV